MNRMLTMGIGGKSPFEMPQSKKAAIGMMGRLDSMKTDLELNRCQFCCGNGCEECGFSGKNNGPGGQGKGGTNGIEPISGDSTELRLDILNARLKSL